MKYRILEKCRNGKVHFYPQRKSKFCLWFSYFYTYDHHAEGEISVRFDTLSRARHYIASDINKRAQRQISYTKIHDIG